MIAELPLTTPIKTLAIAHEILAEIKNEVRKGEYVSELELKEITNDKKLIIEYRTFFSEIEELIEKNITHICFENKPSEDQIKRWQFLMSILKNHHAAYLGSCDERVRFYIVIYKLIQHRFTGVVHAIQVKSKDDGSLISTAMGLGPFPADEKKLADDKDYTIFDPMYNFIDTIKNINKHYSQSVTLENVSRIDIMMKNENTYKDFEDQIKQDSKKLKKIVEKSISPSMIATQKKLKNLIQEKNQIVL